MVKMLKITGVLVCILTQMWLKANAQGGNAGVQQPDSGIAFLKDVSWKMLLQKARERDEIIFIDVSTTWCVPCKKMEKEIFPLKEVRTFYNDNFISYQADAEKGVGLKIANQFNVHAYPTYLFVNKEGALIYKGGGYDPAPEAFIAMGKKALSMQADSLNLSYYRREYPDNKNNKVFVRNYLNLLHQQGLSDIGLLDQFVSLLSDKALLDPANALLIIKMVETSDSKAFGAIIQNQKALAKVIPWGKTRFNKWDNEYPPESILAIALEHIEMHDFMKAMSSQNERLYKTAILSANKIENAGHQFVTITIPLTKVKFYALAEDTIHLHDVAYHFADSLMHVSSRSIDSVDKRKYEESEKKYFAPQMDSSRVAYFISHKEDYRHLHSEYIGNILNEIAKDYCIFMNDPNKLARALQWSRKAIKLNHLPRIDYTYARLLYKVGQKNESVAVLKGAIKNLEAENEEDQAEDYREDLMKIKNGTL